jgi:hypothetical protein
MASNCPYVSLNYLSVVSSGLYMACSGINLFPGGLFMSCIAVCTSVLPNGLYETHQRGRQRIRIFTMGDPVIYVLQTHHNGSSPTGLSPPPGEERELTVDPGAGDSLCHPPVWTTGGYATPGRGGGGTLAISRHRSG